MSSLRTRFLEVRIEESDDVGPQMSSHPTRITRLRIATIPPVKVPSQRAILGKCSFLGAGIRCELWPVLGIVVRALLRLVVDDDLVQLPIRAALLAVLLPRRRMEIGDNRR